MVFDKVSIIIRTMIGRLHFLDQALFSVFGNDYPCVEVVIVVQGVDDHYYKKVCELASLYSRLGLALEVVRNVSDLDQRAKNLNLGMKQATGRYIGFLDDDDVFYPDHISSLVFLLQESSQAWAYSQVNDVLIDVDAHGGLYVTSYKLHSTRSDFSYTAFWKDNYLTIHSFLIDREKVESHLLEFNETFIAQEDYYFLLKLSSFHKPESLFRITCEYHLRLDGSNTVCAGEGWHEIERRAKKALWNSARLKLAQMKRELLLLPLPKHEAQGATVASMLLEQYQNELDSHNSHLHQWQAEAQRLQAETQHLQAETQHLKAEMQRLQNDLAHSHSRVAAMETSKFWRLRRAWMKFKRSIRLPSDF